MCRDRLAGYGPTEINSLGLDTHGDTRLVAGCGDNLVHIWDIESGREMVSDGRLNLCICFSTFILCKRMSGFYLFDEENHLYFAGKYTAQFPLRNGG